MKDIVDFYTYMFKNFRNQVVPVTICVKSEKIKNDSSSGINDEIDFGGKER